MNQRPDSARIALLEQRDALQIARQRRERIKQALAQAAANGFDTRRLRADLRAIEAEIRKLQPTNEEFENAT